MHIHLPLEKRQKGTNIPSLFLGPYQKYLSAFWHLIPFVIFDAIYPSAGEEDEVLQKHGGGWVKLHKLRPQRWLKATPRRWLCLFLQSGSTCRCPPTAGRAGARGGGSSSPRRLPTHGVAGMWRRSARSRGAGLSYETGGQLMSGDSAIRSACHQHSHAAWWCWKTSSFSLHPCLRIPALMHMRTGLNLCVIHNSYYSR